MAGVIGQCKWYWLHFFSLLSLVSKTQVNNTSGISCYFTSLSCLAIYLWIVIYPVNLICIEISSAAFYVPTRNKPSFLLSIVFEVVGFPHSVITIFMQNIIFLNELQVSNRAYLEKCVNQSISLPWSPRKSARKLQVFTTWANGNMLVCILMTVHAHNSFISSCPRESFNYRISHYDVVIEKILQHFHYKQASYPMAKVSSRLKFGKEYSVLIKPPDFDFQLVARQQMRLEQLEEFLHFTKIITDNSSIIQNKLSCLFGWTNQT